MVHRLIPGRLPIQPGQQPVIHRAALIGCGLIGSELADDPLVDGVHSHAGAYTRSPLTTLVAVCDVDGARARTCGERWAAIPYQDCAAMLAELQPDLVSVCTPDGTHFEVLKTVLAASSVRGVLAEKPLALTVEQAEEIARLAQARGVRLAVNYLRRYADSHRRLQEFVASGGIGEIQTVGGYYTKGLFHNGTHWFDLARFLVGEIALAWGRDVLHEDVADPTLDAFLQFESGAAAHLQACSASAYSIFEMDLLGTRGRVRVTDSGHVFHTYEAADSTRFSGYRELRSVDGLTGGLGDVLLNAVEDLARAVNEETDPVCSGADGVAALRVAQAVRDAAASGRIVELRTADG